MSTGHCRAANVERLVELLCEFDEKDPSDPSTWDAPQRRERKMKELNNTGMLEVCNHQYLWDNRMEERVYDVFVDIRDREDLCVTIDRANLNPPKKVKGDPNGFIHWDVETSVRPVPIGVQGVLSLQEQDGGVRGFQCMPYLFEHFEEWVKTQPEDRDPMHPDMTWLEVVDMEPADLTIFNSLLAHGVQPSHSDNRVRWAQYISMHPAQWENEADRLERIRLWRELDYPWRPLLGRSARMRKAQGQDRHTHSARGKTAWP